ncbi:MAG TPA: hypothetical protein VHD36_12060 [Pirellulales bacterium]|nr:hypothetical protein [Pirellulales bacterium]
MPLMSTEFAQATLVPPPQSIGTVDRADYHRPNARALAKRKWFGSDGKPVFSLEEDPGYREKFERLQALRGELAEVRGQIDELNRQRRLTAEERRQAAAAAMISGATNKAGDAAEVPQLDPAEMARLQDRRATLVLALGQQEAIVQTAQRDAAKKIVTAHRLKEKYGELVRKLFQQALALNAAQAEKREFEHALSAAGLDGHVPLVHLGGANFGEPDDASGSRLWYFTRECKEAGYDLGK